MLSLREKVRIATEHCLEVEKVLAECAEQLEECNADSKLRLETEEAFLNLLAYRKAAQAFEETYNVARQAVQSNDSVLEQQQNVLQTSRVLKNQKGSVEHRDFAERVWEVNHPDEQMPFIDSPTDLGEDITVSATRISLNCPITQTRFVDPVRNQYCGHVYSRAAICSLENTQGSGGIRGNEVQCPIAGCSQVVRVNRLQPAQDIITRLERLSRPRLFP